MHDGTAGASSGPGAILRGASFAAGLVVFAYAIEAWVLQPTPGTATGPRLRGLLTIAAAALGVALTRRLSRRGRGAVMLVVGLVTCVVTASIPLMHVVKHQVGVREFLGVAALAGGLVLVVIGSIELLGSTDRRKRRWLLVLALPATYLLVQFLLLPLGFAFYVTNAPRPQLGPRTPVDVGVPYTDVRMRADGTTLAGWWVPSRNGAAVIVLHGSGSTRDDVLDHAALLAEHGYGILMYDARGHGESGGRIMELGWNTVRDVSVGIDYVLAQPDVTERVGILGLSMGGEVALAAAASDPRIAAVVSEGAGVPTFQDMQAVEPPFTSASGWVTYSVADFLSDTGPPIPLVEAVKTIAPRPVLLISGADAPERRANPVYAAGGVSTTLWELPDTAHTQALATHPHEYERRVTGFLATALLPSGAD